MGTTPTTTKVDQVVQQFKALGDEKRLRILMLLSEGERCVCELQDALGSGQSLLSFHLKMLKESKLVTDRRDGRWVYYGLDREGFADLERLLHELRKTSDSAGAPTFRICD